MPLFQVVLHLNISQSVKYVLILDTQLMTAINRDFIPPQMRYLHQGNNNKRFNQGYNQRNVSAYMATPETLWMRASTRTAGQPIT